MTQPLIFILLLVVTFISRWWPRWVRPNALDSDTYYHLAQAENIRQYHFHLPKKHEGFCLPGKYIYPPVYHYFLALFPKKFSEEVEKFSSALFDTALVAIFWWTITTYLDVGWDVTTHSILALVFAFSPALVGIGTGPRAYQGTARTLGELLISIVFLALWLYWQFDLWIWLIVALTTGALSLITSKFAGQVLLFFCLISAFLLNSTWLLIFPFVCAVLAIIISNGQYWHILVAQIGHLYLYATIFVERNLATRNRKYWSWPKGLKNIIHTFLFHNVFTILVIKFGIILFVTCLIVWKGDWLVDNTSFVFPTIWILAAFIVFLIVSTPKFVFIGEADRYLEYALIPAFLIFGHFLTPYQHRTTILITLLLFHLALYSSYLWLFIRHWHIERPQDFPELLEKANEFKPTVLLSLLGPAPWQLAYQTHHKIWFSESFFIDFTPEEYSQLFWRLGMPHPNWKNYIKKYNIQLIAASKVFLISAQSEGCYYNFTNFQAVFENHTYILYQVPQAYINPKVSVL